MNKILAATSLFIIALFIGVKFKHWPEFELTERESGEIEHHQDGPEEFAKYHLAIRTRSDESKPGYPANYQLKELKKAKEFAALRMQASARIQSTSGNGVISFTERGPANIPGRTRGLIVDPDDSNHKTWFVGSAGGGVWKTIDAGVSWQWLTPNIPNMATTTLAMAESNHNVIYAGTGEQGFDLVDGVNGMGIFKSIDRGATWNALPASSILSNVTRLAVDPDNENNILAACNKGIYHSTDGGSTWNQAYAGWVQDLRATPGNFSVMYATERSVGVLKSIDGGVTWNLSNTAMSPTGRIEIAVSPVKTDRIIASAQGNLSGTNSDLYLSDDGGNTWNLVALNLSNKILDHLSSQGWYDNTVAFSPYSKDVVYIGGVGTYQVTLGAPVSSISGSYSIQGVGTNSFLSLQTFKNPITQFQGKVESGSAANHDLIEVRFGPGLHQFAHRFLVPDGATTGVPDANYSYQDYVDVPFQVWNATTNQQLMVSFRDQDRNGVFDLIPQNTDATDATLQSREYIFIQNVPYSSSPSSNITKNGGQTYQSMFFFWPVLAANTTWDPQSLPNSKLQIIYSTLNLFSSTVKSVADVYSIYDGVNNSDYVHPDQHNIYPIKQNDALKTFQLLMANDGGVFLSKIAASPGTTQGDWKKVGNGYNTSQFYGADKRPGAQEYFGGMQDNGTWFTPKGIISSSSTYFVTNPNLGGDGFNVLWNSFDEKKMIGGSQRNYLVRSLDGGISWSTAFSGLTLANGAPDKSKFPFITKLIGSKQAPDRIFTVGSEGVWKSTDFGGSWNVTSMGSGWGGNDSFMDAAVSRANSNIVWAGPGQFGGGNLFVSTNAGDSFTKVPNPSGLTLGNISRIATHPWEPNTAYAIYSFANTAKILKTTDLGQTWTDISGFGAGTSSNNGFPDVAVYCLYVRPDDPNIIWAGTEIGIVESLDGGSSWTLLTSFPSVAVWEMKGQDNEIVIATHGRGIWTATLSNDQNGISKVLAFGTSPQSVFKLIVDFPVKYDSVILKFNSSIKTKVMPPDSGTYIISLKNIPSGPTTIQTISYKGGISATSPITNSVNLKLTNYQKTFLDLLNNGSNFYLDGFSTNDFGAWNKSLQTQHNYFSDRNLTATLLVPIVVSSGDITSFIYDDVALVQPGANGSVFGQKAFNDYVVAEATKDGLNWTPIAKGYNSSAQASWLTAYNGAAAGSPSMVITENFDLKTNFQSGDTLLIRFRLSSNRDNQVGWGWSIDNLYIQQTPTAVEPAASSEVSIYPNPSPGKFKINYTLMNESDVTVNVWDATGRTISSQNLENRSKGKNESELNLEGAPEGVYLVRVKTQSSDRVIKIMVRK